MTFEKGERDNMWQAQLHRIAVSQSVVQSGSVKFSQVIYFKLVVAVVKRRQSSGSMRWAKMRMVSGSNPSAVMKKKRTFWDSLYYAKRCD